jgi:hypothetical protein
MWFEMYVCEQLIRVEEFLNVAIYVYILMLTSREYKKNMGLWIQVNVSQVCFLYLEIFYVNCLLVLACYSPYTCYCLF